MKRIFLTGGTGFLGSHMLAALHAGGYSVIAATRVNVSALPDHLVDHRTEWVSTENASSVIASVKPQAVIHLATEYGINSALHDTLLSNEAWPLRLLEAAIRAGTEVFLNTDSFFAKPAFAYPHMRPYTLSKSNFLAWGRHAAARTGTRFVTLRLEHVFGENDGPNKFVPSMIRQLRAGDAIDATAGTQRRDFVYAGDVANAFLTVLERHEALCREMDDIEVGTGRSVTVRSFVELAKSVSGSSSVLKFGNVPMRQNEIMDSFADTSILRTLGWAAQTSLEDGLRRCMTDAKQGD